MDIDTRINTIMEKMKHLTEKHPAFSCGEFPPKWKKPLSEETVAKYEEKNKITLPEDYKRFITTIASSGTQPFYGLYSIQEIPKYELTSVIQEKFPYTVRTPLNIADLSDEEYDAVFETKNAGFIPLCHEGCGMYSILIVNTEDKDTYGTVWYYDLANDAGIFPLINPVTKKTMTFLDWLEYYVDQTLELDDFDFFSYGELVGIVQ